MGSDGDETTGEPAKRRGGRPRKYPGTEKRPTLQFRARGETYERLKHAAEASDRSISEEIEHVITSYWAHAEQIAEDRKDPAYVVADGVRQALRLAALSSGSQFHETDLGYEAAVAAIDGVKALMRPPEGYRERKATATGVTSPLAALGRGLGLEGFGQSQEQIRAGAIGWAAAVEAIRWARRDFSEGLSTEMLMSRGRMLEGLDMDALLALAKKHGMAPKYTNKDDASK